MTSAVGGRSTLYGVGWRAGLAGWAGGLNGEGSSWCLWKRSFQTVAKTRADSRESKPLMEPCLGPRQNGLGGPCQIRITTHLLMSQFSNQKIRPREAVKALTPGLPGCPAVSPDPFTLARLSWLMCPVVPVSESLSAPTMSIHDKQAGQTQPTEQTDLSSTNSHASKMSQALAKQDRHVSEMSLIQAVGLTSLAVIQFSVHLRRNQDTKIGGGWALVSTG